MRDDGRDYWPMSTVYTETTLPNGDDVSWFARVQTQDHNTVEVAMLRALEMRPGGMGCFLGCEVVLTAPHGVTTRRVLDFDGEYLLRPI